ncbi:MAG: site-specific integrase [Tannerellaceae bacterium]|nr:site-specific integrase [Tannerellaceae bacterium]
MDTYLLNGVTVALFLDTRREKKSGKFPVKVRVTYQRKRKYYPTGKDLSPEEWEKMSNPRGARLVAIKEDLQIAFDKVKRIVRMLEEEDTFTFEALSLYFGKGEGKTLNQAFREKIKDQQEAGAAGTAIVYDCALKHLETFVGGTDLPFNAVTVDWLLQYELAMLNEGKSYTTISIYIRCIRTLFNEALTAKTIKKSLYPFGKHLYEIPQGEGRKLALTLQEIQQIINFTDGNESTERYRDFWFFSYLCNGININDMMKLKYANIVGDEIRFFRSKTLHTSNKKREIVAILTPEMQQIIARWGNSSHTPSQYIFPCLNGKEDPVEQHRKIQILIRKINQRLKVIATKLGLPTLSTYTARHSFATVLKRSGANIAYISESLGHADLKTTEHYLDSFEKEDRRKAASLLTNF